MGFSFGRVTMATFLLGASVTKAATFEHGKTCVPCADQAMDETCQVNMKVDLYASSTGYYTIDGCEGVNPTLHLTLNKVYKFDQSDISNWYHLIGFAYEADGAHIPVDELEPGITRLDGSDCGDPNFSCPAPMYFMDGEYQGTYSNIDFIKNVTTGEDDFGLDAVEPLFFHPLGDWEGYGKFETYLKFDQAITVDFFYFCHIHAGMSGRIKLLDADGNLLNPNSDTPDLPYEYDDVSEYDLKCGTTGLSGFRLPNDQCQSTYVCLQDGAELSTFADCLNSMNCAMMNGMTTTYEGREALFCHQMIPHHENAINMAKSVLKNVPLECNQGLAAEEGAVVPVGCDMIPLLYDIINVQNSQIIDMQDVLSQLSVAETANCDVDFSLDVGRKLSKEEEDFAALRDLTEGGAFEHGKDCVPSCNGQDECVIKVLVNPFAGQQGYYEFEGCEGVNPTLHLTVGQNYLFDQSDISNWYHLIGFAYEADGAHVGVDELEPGIVPPGTSITCDTDNSCPSPYYYMNGTFAGDNADNPFGLDTVEPLFFHPLADWEGYGPFTAKLVWNVDPFGQDIFYFCHIHSDMTGRIKLVKPDGAKLSEADTPAIPYEYDVVTGHDEECGTFALNDFKLPNAQCPEEFVCEKDSTGANEESGPRTSALLYAQCIDSMNCAMFDGMTTNYGGDNPKNGGSDDLVLFLRQMISHHENAINMAKTLLFSDVLACGNFATEEGSSVATGCILEPIVRGILVTQNQQIQTMKGLLERFEVELVSDCDASEGSDSTSGGAMMWNRGFFSAFVAVALLVAGVSTA